MFCIKCGKENKSDSKFCICCGEKLDADENINANEDEKANATESYTAIKQPKSVIQEFKRFVFSPLVIVAVVLFTMYIVSSIVGAGNIITNTIDEIGDYLNIRDLEYYFESIFGFALDVVNDIFRIIVLVIMIPNIVICIGLWITLYSAYDKKAVTITTAGIKMVKAVNIVNIVFNCIPAFLYLFSFILDLIRWSGHLQIFDWILLILILGIIALRLFYLIMINRTIKSFIDSVKFNKIFMGTSKFVAVMLIISGAFQCLLGLFSFATFSMWCSALSSICFALIIFKFRNLCEYKLKEE